jgi:tRNA-2-methylthio-N6-dimethylallyladenosine synthase
VILVNTCSIREKAQEKVFSQLGRWKQLKKKPTQGDHRRRRLRGQPGGRGDRQARALRRPGVRPADPAPPARDDRGQARERPRRRSTSASPRSRSSTACPSRAPKAPAPSSRSWRAAASTAPSAWCPTPAAKKSAGPSTTCCRSRPARRAGRARGQPAGPERQRLPRRDRTTAAVCDLGLLIRAIAEIDGIGRIRFTTSHPVEFSDSLIAPTRRAAAGQLPAPAGAGRLRPHPGAMKRGHTALEYKQKIRKLRAVRPDISISSDFIVGFPGETEADFEDHEADRGRRLRPELLLRLQRAPRHAGRQPARRDAGAGEEAAPVPAAGGDRRQRPPISQAMVGSVQRVLVEGPSRKTRPNSPAAPRTCVRELRRPAAADRPVRRRGDHRGDAIRRRLR